MISENCFCDMMNIFQRFYDETLPKLIDAGMMDDAPTILAMDALVESFAKEADPEYDDMCDLDGQPVIFEYLFDTSSKLRELAPKQLYDKLMKRV